MFSYNRQIIISTGARPTASCFGRPAAPTASMFIAARTSPCCRLTACLPPTPTGIASAHGRRCRARRSTYRSLPPGRATRWPRPESSARSAAPTASRRPWTPFCPASTSRSTICPTATPTRAARRPTARCADRKPAGAGCDRPI